MQSKQPNIQLTQHYVKKVLGTYIKRALKSFQKVKSNFSHNTNLFFCISYFCKKSSFFVNCTLEAFPDSSFCRIIVYQINVPNIILIPLYYKVRMPVK